MKQAFMLASTTMLWIAVMIAITAIGSMVGDILMMYLDEKYDLLHLLRVRTGIDQAA